MAIWDMFRGFFKKDGTLNISECSIGDLTAEIFYKELAINSAINLISNTISNAEFLTYQEGKEVKGDNYYLFNVEPNQNKSANKFWRDVVYKLVYDNECLVIQNDDMFYVAESFEKKEFAFKENVYTDVYIGDYKLDSPYFESQVMHFELHSEQMKRLIDGLYSSYGKLITASKRYNLRKKARRGILNIDTSFSQTDGNQAKLDDLLGNQFKTYFEAENGAVLPLQKGLDFQKEEEHVTNNPSQEGRDIRNFIDDIFDFVALAFNIPPQLLRGDVADTEKAVDNFLTFCVNPLADLLTDEINRKYYKRAAYLKRTYVKLDTTRVKHVDIEKIANALDILIRTGTNTINDNLRILGREEIDEPWANQRFFTKNYDKIANFMKGGE